MNNACSGYGDLMGTIGKDFFGMEEGKTVASINWKLDAGTRNMRVERVQRWDVLGSRRSPSAERQSRSRIGVRPVVPDIVKQSI